MSGGNKCRRKKCRWNICHLGINVVQSTKLINNVARLIKSTINIQLDRSPAVLTSDDFIRSNEIVRNKWPIY